MLENLDLVNWVIRTRISVPNRPLLTYDDFYAIGCEAICRAALKYQADSGEFAPFACRYIYNAIVDHCRAMNYRLQRSVDAGFEEGEILFDLLAHTTVDFEAEVTDNSAMTMCEREFGCRAVAPHAYLPYLLDDSNPEERALALSFAASLLALCDRLVIYGDRISSGMKEEIRRARKLGIPILNRQTQLSDGSSDPVIVGRYINGISLNGLEYLKNDADEVIFFAGVEAAKVYLREHGVTEDEMEDMVFRKSVGTCFRCGDPLFLSDIPEYTCQCFRCDEDFYSIEQDVDL